MWKQLCWCQGGWSQTPTAQHLRKHPGNTSSFPFPWLKTHCKGFQKTRCEHVCSLWVFPINGIWALPHILWKHVSKNGKTYISAFKALWYLWSHFLFQKSCSGASTWRASLGEALLNTSFTAAVPGSLHSHCTADKNPLGQESLSHWGAQISLTLMKKCFSKFYRSNVIV